MITAVSEATVPKICVVVRKAYGAGLYAMAGPGFEPDATIALPTAKIAVMGAEAAVNAVYANKIAAIEDAAERAAFVADKRAEYETDIDFVRLASELVIDDIVEPADLRVRPDRPLPRGRGQGPLLLPPPSRRHPGLSGGTPMDHRLSEEYEALRATVEEFAHDVVAPKIGDFYEREEFPYEIVAQMGRMGLFGLPFPEEYGGMGGDYFALCLALEELARVDSSVAITLEAGVSPRRDADLPLRHRGAEAAVAAQALLRRDARRLRPDRARRRLRRRRHPHHRGARRRRVGDQRHEVLHHQLRHRHHRPDHRHRGHRHAEADGRKEISTHHRPVRHPRPHRAHRSTARSAGTPPTPASCPSPTSASPRRTSSASEAAATPTSCASWTRAASPSPPCPPASPRAASTSR